ncbi:hypothetical protein PAXRUDRAFT_17493 [Paxillus rubicundulus Ve08.2h10]|uniref:Uncharacterized protein n=1 Tax=Paxillus rubicundulus Ve08.2h10 TaxID=930991 RepID=A0A0D0CQ38_9AGAM|nr:hypothetical protein PAXRUDRAFT_17493 [Paxillus rubicundulus Ve08.2h10]
MVLIPQLLGIGSKANMKVYKQHAKRLTVTGEGIGPESEDDADETCRCFI